MTEEIISFIDYWNAVDDVMLRLFGIDTFDAHIDVDLIAGAEEQCWSPEEFARWVGREYGSVIP